MAHSLTAVQNTMTHICQRIVSGGQTGVDRAALDFAISQGYEHGGWAPSDRMAEDGPLDAKYQLMELAQGGYRQRTRRNVADSDGTLILNQGELSGGTLATRKFAQQLEKPFLVVALDGQEYHPSPREVAQWLALHSIRTLNVAGPRESKCPGIYLRACAFLMRVQACSDVGNVTPVNPSAID